MPDRPIPETVTVPLPALLSQVLVAYIIEFDNEFEHRMPHRTTAYGNTSGVADAPWLVSMAMWQHCLRHVPPGDSGISARDFVRASELGPKGAASIVKRMSGWWGYLDVRGGAALPAAERRLVLTRAGAEAWATWHPLGAEIDARWRSRFGAERVDGLMDALLAVTARFDVELPDFLPVADSPRGWRFDPALARRPAATLKPPAQRTPSSPTLTSELSRMLACFTLDYERHAGAALSLAANVLRVAGAEVPIAELPALSGIARMGIDNALSTLARDGLAQLAAHAGSRRTRVLRLTTAGVAARDEYVPLCQSIEADWRRRFGADRIDDLGSRLESIVDSATPSNESLLLAGAAPHSDGWRAQLPARRVLPHYPMISHRGGFPDGS